MAAHLQQGQYQRGKFVAHGNAGKANTNIGAYTVNGEGRTTHIIGFFGAQADLGRHGFQFFQQLPEFLGLLAVVIGRNQLDRLLQLVHVGLELFLDIGIQHIPTSPLNFETKYLKKYGGQLNLVQRYGPATRCSN